MDDYAFYEEYYGIQYDVEDECIGVNADNYYSDDLYEAFRRYQKIRTYMICG